MLAGFPESQEETLVRTKDTSIDYLIIGIGRCFIVKGQNMLSVESTS